jgi:hypothetical protein
MAQQIGFKEVDEENMDKSIELYWENLNSKGLAVEEECIREALKSSLEEVEPVRALTVKVLM